MAVALLARRADRLEALADEIRAMGGTALALPGDVLDAAACRDAVDRTIDTLGSLDAVFANAGVGLTRSVLETTDDQLREILEINVVGSLNVIRPAAARMLKAGRGHILVCSSCLSKIAAPWHGAYSASKAVQDHLARAMRCELRPTGIRVSSVHPVGTRTEFFDRAAERSGRTASRSGRWMQPSERVARAVVRCLRRPRGEVWTSRTVRLAMGLAVIAPGLADRVLCRAVHEPEQGDNDC